MIAQLEHRPGGISYEDFLAAYGGVRAEWVDGEVVEMTPPTDRHLLIAGFLYSAIAGYLEFNEIDGLAAQAGFQVRLGPRVGREPDVFYLTPEHTYRFKRTFVDGPVDLAIEIISPESRVRDRREKCLEYQQAGVPEYWIIDPDAETLEVYSRSETGTYELVPPGDPPRATSRVLPGMWIDPAWMWVERPRAITALREWGLI
ncbi:Uma2 family endonuclease [Longimicrobium sp.]|uniref:Uma2 family endonuclease n=1 Tax=Longimicrobium sp. TaxID=2029185 RepID=UPI002E2FF006|nr:Uma2 family endonuclease [Longimicrobium sp.]HEX6036795.1 Uma2 family endonuclease [Longimicrobium sp.]